jgi:hypothetical protein
MGCLQTRNVSDDRETFFNSNAGNQTMNIALAGGEIILPQVTNIPLATIKENSLKINWSFKETSNEYFDRFSFSEEKMEQLNSDSDFISAINSFSDKENYNLNITIIKK